MTKKQRHIAILLKSARKYNAIPHHTWALESLISAVEKLARVPKRKRRA